MVVGYLTSIVRHAASSSPWSPATCTARCRIRGRGRRGDAGVQGPGLGAARALPAAQGRVVLAGRYSLTTSNRGPVTGLSYTDVARRPARRDDPRRRRGRARAAAVRQRPGCGRLRWIAVGVGGMLVAASSVFGGLWPSLVYRFREQPSAATLDRPPIARNQAATLTAFGLDHDVTTQAVRRHGSAPPPRRAGARPSGRRRSGCSTPTS